VWALELAQRAREALGLHYEPGLGAMETYPPDRFTWVFADDGDAREYVRVCDDEAGRSVVWPHWARLEQYVRSVSWATGRLRPAKEVMGPWL